MNILMQDGSTIPKDDAHCMHCVNWPKTDWPCSLCILKQARPAFVCEPDPKKWVTTLNEVTTEPVTSVDTAAFPFGTWSNTKGGYGLCKDTVEMWAWVWPRVVYQCTMDPINPLTFADTYGTQYRTGPQFLSDDGSIPPFLQSIPGLSANRFEWSYLLHDFGCKYGGLFCRDSGQMLFHFRRLTRDQIDMLLYKGVGAEGGNMLVRHSIYRGVRFAKPFMKFPELGYWDALTPPKGVPEDMEKKVEPEQPPSPHPPPPPRAGSLTGVLKPA